MYRKFDYSQKLLIASHNNGKVKEIKDLFDEINVQTIDASSLNLKEPIENGNSFRENAIIKAVSISKLSGHISISDDSGLSIRCLNGDPGIFSARWAGEKKDFKVAMEKINNQMLLSNSEDKYAKFTCVLCLAWPDGYSECFEGNIIGTIVWPPRGNNGFGYDSIFLPNDYSITFGEFEPQKKHQISHRSIAFNKLLKACFRNE